MIVAPLIVTACAGDGRAQATPPAAQPSGSIRITMTDYRFNPELVSAQPGDVLLFLVNTGTAGHDLTLLGLDGKRLAASRLVPPGSTARLGLKQLSAGRYRFLCSQPGHEDLGMVGELQVG